MFLPSINIIKVLSEGQIDKIPSAAWQCYSENRNLWHILEHNAIAAITEWLGEQQFYRKQSKGCTGSEIGYESTI